MYILDKKLFIKTTKIYIFDWGAAPPHYEYALFGVWLLEPFETIQYYTYIVSVNQQWYSL